MIYTKATFSIFRYIKILIGISIKKGKIIIVMIIVFRPRAHNCRTNINSDRHRINILITTDFEKIV